MGSEITASAKEVTLGYPKKIEGSKDFKKREKEEETQGRKRPKLFCTREGVSLCIE